MHETSVQDPPSRTAAIYVREPALGARGIECAALQARSSHHFCSSEGITVTSEYADGSGERIAFEIMMADATSGDAPYNLIVVSKPDRFSGSLEETIACRDILRRQGIGLVSATEKGTQD